MVPILIFLLFNFNNAYLTKINKNLINNSTKGNSILNTTSLIKEKKGSIKQNKKKNKFRAVIIVLLES